MTETNAPEFLQEEKPEDMISLVVTPNIEQEGYEERIEQAFGALDGAKSYHRIVRGDIFVMRTTVGAIRENAREHLRALVDEGIVLEMEEVNHSKAERVKRWKREQELANGAPRTASEMPAGLRKFYFATVPSEDLHD